MNKKLSGFWPVFNYTFKNQIKSKKYIAITVIFALLLLVGAAMVFLIVGKPESDDKIDFSIERAYVFDETGLGCADYAGYSEFVFSGDVDSECLKNVEFIQTKDKDSIIEQEGENGDFLLIIQSENEEGYYIRLLTADESDFDDDLCEVFADMLVQGFKLHVYENSGLDEASLTTLIVPVTYEVLSFDSDEDGMKDIIEIVVLMGIMFVLYFVMLLYGVQICTEVTLEKNSKLVEQLLVSVTPYGLVSGKIIAVIFASLMQFVIWIVSLIGGIFGGDYIAEMVYKGYESKLDYIIDVIKTLFGSVAFDIPAVIMAIVVILLGIVFYLVIAGFAGSFVTKPEDASSVQVIFVLPIVISFLAIISNVAGAEGEITSQAFFYIPFTAAMIAPGAILLGKFSVLGGVVSAVILLVCTIVLMVLAAKVYKALLFYSGKKLGIKTIIQMLSREKKK